MKRFLLCSVIIVFSTSLGLAQPQATAPADHHAHAVAPAPSADKIWAELMAGNKRFVAGKTHAYAVVPLRRKLTSGQQPHVIVLSCSDSRVPPELVFDQSLGDLFVVRTAGNIADLVGLGSIEYAVDHFHSPLLVVLGHSKCGAVTAACSGDKMPTPNLEAIVDKIDPAVIQAKTYAKSDDLIEAAIKENVRQSAKDLLANSPIIREAVTSGKLKIVEAEYRLDTGEVSRLDATASPHN
ncbi:MAG: carbonic anhydrase [Terriglobales bacterium]